MKTTQPVSHTLLHFFKILFIQKQTQTASMSSGVKKTPLRLRWIRDGSRSPELGGCSVRHHPSTPTAVGQVESPRLKRSRSHSNTETESPDEKQNKKNEPAEGSRGRERERKREKNRELPNVCYSSTRQSTLILINSLKKTLK